MNEQIFLVDKVLWFVKKLLNGARNVEPLCAKHKLRMYPVTGFDSSNFVRCQDCSEAIRLSRPLSQQRRYVLDKLDSKIFKGMKFINIDDEALPIAESKASSKDSKYFVTAILTESKIGLRLVVYAGEKGKKVKSQIFVEPAIKRLSFDHKDVHPSDIFTSLEAIFDDGSKAAMKK